MRGLTAKEILGVWEVGQQQMPAERALTLLSTFCPQTARDDLERLSIGRRDSLLLSMRELLFGSQFSGMTRCPQCRSTLEIGFSCSDVRTTAPNEPAETFSVNVDEYDFNCRLPNSTDLLAVMYGRSIDSMSNALFERCVTDKRFRGADVSLSDLPAEVIEAVAERSRNTIRRPTFVSISFVRIVRISGRRSSTSCRSRGMSSPPGPLV